jgi:hypothetical protein
MKLLLSCFLTLGFAAVGRADDWPQWMGPGRDDVWKETGILEEFPEGGPKILWRTPIAGGYSGPAVAAGPAKPASWRTIPAAATNCKGPSGSFA